MGGANKHNIWENKYFQTQTDTTLRMELEGVPKQTNYRPRGKRDISRPRKSWSWSSEQDEGPITQMMMMMMMR